MTSIEIPNSVKEIGVCAFQGCSQLQSVTFQKGSLITTLSGGYISKGYGTSIENASKMIFGVFAKCSTLSSIEIPANVETIDACVFCYYPPPIVWRFESSSNVTLDRLVQF